MGGQESVISPTAETELSVAANLKGSLEVSPSPRSWQTLSESIRRYLGGRLNRRARCGRHVRVRNIYPFPAQLSWLAIL